MQPQIIHTPKSQQQNNILKVQSCVAKDKTQYTIQYSMSDLAYQEFSGFNDRIFEVPVQEIQILSKQLDQPLSWAKRLGASVLGIKTKHQFLLFQTAKFLMTIDFYEGNRIRIRVGDIKNVLECQKSQLRKKATIAKTQEGLQWRRRFKQGQLLIKDILHFIKHKQLQRAHSKISFNGSHFSRKLWTDLVELVDKRNK